MTYQFLSHPASCACCGGGLFDFISPDETMTLSPSQWINKLYSGNQANTTLISESDVLSRKSEMGLSDQDWYYVSSLFDSTANLFFKWGDELGTAPELTYSFVDGGPFLYDSSYTADLDGDFGTGTASSFSDYSGIDPDHFMIEFTDEEKEFIRATLDWYGDASGIQFTEVTDSSSTYGDLRFFLQDFDAWLDFDPSAYSAGGFAWMPWGDGWNGDTGNGWAPAGDVFLRSDYDLYNGYTETVIAHEIGHALGLSHPFDGYYNNIGSINDSVDNSFTVMTYDQYPEILGINPMPIDLLAMEFLYGGDESANSGDDVYTLDANLFDVSNNSFFIENGWTYGADARMSILDYGGVDHIDALAFDNGIFMNLQPGSWSNFYGADPILVSYTSDGATAQIASSFDNETSIDVASDDDILNFGQLYISSNTFIEGCVLTAYDDVLFDNDSGNLIECYEGDDRVSSSFGDDYVFGGAGFDHVSLYGAATDYMSTYVGDSEDGGGVYQLTNGERVVTLDSVEEISFFGDDSLFTSIYLIENFAGEDPDDIDTDPGYTVIDLAYESDYQTSVFKLFNQERQDYWDSSRSSGVYFYNSEAVIETVYPDEVAFAHRELLSNGNMCTVYAVEGASGFWEYYFRLYDTETSEFLGEAVQIATDVNLTAGSEYAAQAYVWEAGDRVYFDLASSDVNSDYTYVQVAMQSSGDSLVPAWPYNPTVYTSNDPYPNSMIVEENGGLSWYANYGYEYPITSRQVDDYSWEFLPDGKMVFTYVSNSQAFYRLFNIDSLEFIGNEVEVTHPNLGPVGSFWPWEIADGIIALMLYDENYEGRSKGFFELVDNELVQLQPFSDVVYSYTESPLQVFDNTGGIFINDINGDAQAITYSSDFISYEYYYTSNGEILIAYNKWSDIHQDFAGYYRVFNILDNTFVTAETIIGVGEYTTIEEIADGKYLFNIERYDDSLEEYIYSAYLIESDGLVIEPIDGHSTILGADADFFIGDIEADYVETGGGDDQIMSGAGDDYVVVQGTGEVRVDTGAGDDHIVVEDTFSGTVFLKNGAGFNTLELLGDYENIEAVFKNGGMTITNGDSGNVINIEGQHVLNEETGLVEIADTGFQFIKIYGHDTDGNFEDYATYIVAGNDEANYLFAGQPDDAEEQDEVYVYGGAGSDTIDVSAANAVVEGGIGDDVIYIDAVGGEKLVFGDIFNGDSNGISSENVSYADVVKIGWSYEDSTIEAVGAGYRIENVDLGAVVEVYDVELLKFQNADGSWDDRALTDGAPIAINSKYGDGSDIKFVVSEGDNLQVLAAGRRGDTVLWEGNRLEVDGFNFSDGVSINVINISDADVFDNPIVYTMGTEGVDLIFGNDSDNLIDGKGGDDIIFGGGGNDVIIGGEGNDVITGGAGDDIIRGDGVDVDDAAAAYFEDAGVSSDSLSASDMITDGNDTIIGGDGVDDIESGNGENFVASGRVDLDGDGAADLDLIKEHMTTNQDVFDDDEWI
jgi:Ca2+-binding RTX toxin-like protein